MQSKGFESGMVPSPNTARDGQAFEGMGGMCAVFEAGARERHPPLARAAANAASVSSHGK